MLINIFRERDVVINMNCKKLTCRKKKALLLGVVLSASTWHGSTVQALTTLHDATFMPYINTGLTATGDDYIIQTTTATTSPQTVSLSVSNGKTLTIASSNKFIVTNTTNGVNTIDSANGTLHAISELEVNTARNRGIFLGGTGGPNPGLGIFDKKVTVNATANNALGIFIYGRGQGQFKDEVAINMSGTGGAALAMQAMEPDVTLSGTFDKKVTIRTNSTGIFTDDSTGTGTAGILHFKDGVDVETVTGVAILSSNNFNGKIQVDGTSRIISQDTSNYSAIESQAGLIEINGTSTIQGNIEAVSVGSVLGKVSLNLNSGSTIIGMMDNYTQDTPPGMTPGSINVNFQSAGSTWKLTDTSYINTLSGKGHLSMTTDIANNTATVLNVTDSGGATGTHTVTVADTGTGSVADTHEQLLIATNGGGATFTMPTLANIGAYQYDIMPSTGNANDWVLYKSAGHITPTAKAVFNDIRTGYLMNISETQTLLQRMGELRDADENTHDGVWARVLFGEYDVAGKGALSGFTQKFNGVQVGLDRRIDTNNNSRWYLGGMFGYTHGSQSYETGSGKINAYSLGAYGTYIKDNGFYVDNVLKFGMQKQNFSLYDNLGSNITSDSKTKNISWSTEIGYRHYLEKGKKEGWYLEPQGQFTLGHITGDSFRTSNGMDVKFNNYNMALGRIGFLAGYTIKKSENPINVYMKAFYTHEFSGALESRMNDDWLKTDLGSSWWTYGLGVNAKVGKTQSVYFDVERSTGGDFKQLWKLNGGYRFTW